MSRWGWLPAALLCSVPWLARGSESVLESPVASQLAFPAGELDAFAERNWRKKLAQEEQAGLLGCRHDCKRIEAIFGKLVLAAARIVDAPDMHWQLAIGSNPREDAWSLSGGRVYISEAFIASNALGDAGIAFVLAHEMGHVLLQHENEALTLAMALIPRGFSASVENVYAELDYNIGLALKLQPEWQAEEFEADRAGMLIGGAAGFEADELLSYLARLAQEPQDARPVVDTHPQATERLARARTFRGSALVLRERYGTAARE